MGRPGGEPRRPLRPLAFVGVLAVLTVLAAAALSWDFTALSTGAERSAAFERLWLFLGSFGSPDLSTGTLSQGLELTLETLSVALLGVALAAVAAWPLALLASRCVVEDIDGAGDPDSPVRSRAAVCVREAARVGLDVLRGVPDFAWALLVYSFTGNGPLTGILAIAISVTGILGKIYSELWDSVDPRSYAALRSTGASRLAVLLYGIQPLAARGMLSFTLMRTECAVRNASVIGIVGGGGIGKSLFEELSLGNYGKTVTFLLFTLVLTASVDLAANLLRRQFRIDPNHPRAPVDTTLAAGLYRRAGGVLAVLALLAFAVWTVRDGLRHGLFYELQRLEWGWIARNYVQLLQPSLDPSVWKQAAAAAVVPLALGWLVTLVSTGIAAAIALPASYAFMVEPDRFTGEAVPAWRRLLRAALMVGARGLALVMRAVPEVAWVLVFGHLFYLGMLAGLCGMVLHSAGVLARVFTETVDNVPYQRYERGFFGSRSQTFLWVAVPESLADWKTYAMFQLEVNVRIGVVLGIVGLGGLGDEFDTALSATGWDLHRASVFLLAMVALTVLLDRTSRALSAHRVGCGGV